MYATYMGAIDRIDKTVAYVRVSFGRCVKRYHRVIFFWFISTIGLHNLMVIFKWLYSKYVGNFDELYKKHDGLGIGYTTWVQMTLARKLIEHGVQRAVDELPDGVERPHFIPGQAGRPAKSGVATSLPKRCQFVHGSEIVMPGGWQSTVTSGGNKRDAVTLGYSHCRQCYQPFLPAIPGVQEEQPKWRRQTAWGCAGCKVNLCSWACFLAFDHVHRCQRRGQVVQYARVVPESVVGPRVESPAMGGAGRRRGGRRAGRGSWRVSSVPESRAVEVHVQVLGGRSAQSRSVRQVLGGRSAQSRSVRQMHGRRRATTSEFFLELSGE